MPSAPRHFPEFVKRGQIPPQSAGQTVRSVPILCAPTTPQTSPAATRRSLSEFGEHFQSLSVFLQHDVLKRGRREQGGTLRPRGYVLQFLLPPGFFFKKLRPQKHVKLQPRFPAAPIRRQGEKRRRPAVFQGKGQRQKGRNEC